MKNKRPNNLSIKPNISAVLFTTCILLIFLFSCANSGTSSKKSRVTHNLTVQAGRLLEKKYGTKLIGIGGRSDNGKTHLRMIGLQIDHLVDKEEARILAVNVANQFLKCINESEKIRPYLSEYPFTVKNIEVNIFVQPMNNIKAIYPYPTVISVEKGHIRYRFRKTGYEDRYASTEKETYEEALAIIAKSEEQHCQQPKSLETPSSPPISRDLKQTAS